MLGHSSHHRIDAGLILDRCTLREELVTLVNHGWVLKYAVCHIYGAAPSQSVLPLVENFCSNALPLHPQITVGRRGTLKGSSQVPVFLSAVEQESKTPARIPTQWT